MKYVVGLLVVIFLVRIDMFLGALERLGGKIKSAQERGPDPDSILAEPTEIISIKEDKAIGRTPKSEFFTLLNDFYQSPTRETRERVVALFRREPKILGAVKDPVFEGELLKMSDLVYNKSTELPLLLLDFLGILEGENLDLIKRFFTMILDNDFDQFVATYSRSKDSNCIIASTFPHPVPEDEIMNELLDREYAITEFLKKEKIDPLHQGFARGCLMVVKHQINKLAPQVLPSNSTAAPEESASASTDPQSTTPNQPEPMTPEQDLPVPVIIIPKP